MKFFMPTKVYDESDCVAAHAAELAALGNKALIVTGRHSAEKCGALQDVKDALDQCGKAYCHFNEIEENPSTETVLRGAAFGGAEDVDFVIGIGGGSPMDAAKAIAFILKKRADARKADRKDDRELSDEEMLEIMYDKAADPEALPVAAVPTTCGTGSEVTGVAVLTIHEKQTKISMPHRIFPKLALVDGKYLQAASLSMLCNTAVDAFAHMAESYLSAKADAYSRALALEGLRIWSESKGVLLAEREPSEADFENMIRASCFGGMAIAQTGTALPHGLSYIVTYDLAMPHGMACGYFLPGFFRAAGEVLCEPIFEAAGFIDVADFEAFLKNVYPSITVPEETLTRTYEALAANEARLNACCFPVDPEILKTIVGIG